MYLDFKIKVPDIPGKIYPHSVKDTTYIQYEYDRIYKAEKQYNIPKRTTIGKQCSDDPSMRTLIKDGTVVDPANKISSRLNLLIENGKVAGLTKTLPEADTVISAKGKIVCPGFIDIHMP